MGFIGGLVVEGTVMALAFALIVMSESDGAWLKDRAQQLEPGRGQRYVSLLADRAAPVATVLLLTGFVGLLLLVGTAAHF